MAASKPLPSSVVPCMGNNDCLQFKKLLDANLFLLETLRLVALTIFSFALNSCVNHNISVVFLGNLTIRFNQ
jgi:hypothetical protein